MSFLDVLSRVSDEDIAKTLDVVTDDEILSTLSKAVLDIDDALILLSPQALLYLEDMAQLAHERTDGTAIWLYYTAVHAYVHLKLLRQWLCVLWI